jgi:hypothetical protein
MDIGVLQKILDPPPSTVIYWRTGQVGMAIG